MKKRNYLLVILLSSFLLGGCNPVVYKPDPSEYIEWDGNFFY